MAINKIFIVLFLSVAFNRYNAQPSLKFDIELPTNNVINHNDLLLKLRFTNLKETQQIIFPKYLDYGFDFGIDDYNNSDVVIEVEKLEGNTFKKQKSDQFIDRIPLMDLYDTIQPKKDIIFQVDLNGYYSFTKGQYRVRAKLIVPKVCKINDKYIYSNWITFKVQSYIHYPEIGN